MGCNPTKDQEKGQNKPMYPDMKLYEEIIFLEHYFKGNYCVENVIAFYDPLIKPKKLQRHWFWTNYPLNEQKFPDDKHDDIMEECREKVGIDLRDYDLKSDHKTIYRNCVSSDLGLYIFQTAYKDKQEVLFN